MSLTKEYTMPLNQLLSVIGVDTAESCVVHSLQLDSRLISEGALFVAYPGLVSDGRDYIKAAQDSGAIAVVYEPEGFDLPADISIPAFAITDLQAKVGILANQFYAQPSTEMQVFGVTGTNGKTTCCYLLAQALTKLGMKTAFIGTIGVGLLESLSTNSHTTPNPISIHRLLAEWRDQGITHVCMEVSSHALDQARISAVQFFCTLFTNLSHDHLDYHGDMASYQAAKQKLFTDYPAELVVTNADDVMGAGLIDIANSDFIASYGQHLGDVRFDEVVLSDKGMKLFIETSQIEFEVSCELVGKVNLPNILMLVTTLLSLSISVEEIQQIVAALKPAPGRMELYSADNRPSVVVDYAHTPDALEKALLSIKQHCQGSLWCVFGCGGDRDKTKRPLMGQVVARLADRAIITNDNPRSEQANHIAEQIAAGVSAKDADKLQVILDRADAIKSAITMADSRDWVLIAGKGHETTQLINEQVIPFSDREQVLQCLEVAA